VRRVVLSVADDGLVINPSSLRERAIQSSPLLWDAVERLCDKEAVALIFSLGSFTAE
jgi:chemotaxis protein histidine kinase CheA